MLLLADFLRSRIATERLGFELELQLLPRHLGRDEIKRVSLQEPVGLPSGFLLGSLEEAKETKPIIKKK